MKAPSKQPRPSKGSGAGELYVISTPIGNMDDITLRALDVLRRVDLIACEDTRRLRKLLAHYKIPGKKLLSYYRGVEENKIEQLLTMLRQGNDIALASDAGTPGIADPGSSLIKKARQLSLPITVVPGACAAIAALTISGLPTDSFLFLGYLPRKKKERSAWLAPLRWERRTLIFYEAPHRLSASLKEIAAVFGGRQIAVVRELTKLNEEVIVDKAHALVERLNSLKFKGEITLVLAGYNETPWLAKSDWGGYSLASHLSKVMQEEGLSLSRAVLRVEQLRDVPRDVLYRIAKECGLENRAAK